VLTIMTESGVAVAAIACLIAVVRWVTPATTRKPDLGSVSVRWVADHQGSDLTRTR
jgi:hypothetical protein